MTWAEFVDMGGRGFYVWMSFGAFAVSIVAELVALRAKRRKLDQELTSYYQRHEQGKT